MAQDKCESRLPRPSPPRENENHRVCSAIQLALLLHPESHRGPTAGGQPRQTHPLVPTKVPRERRHSVWQAASNCDPPCHELMRNGNAAFMRRCQPSGDLHIPTVSPRPNGNPAHLLPPTPPTPSGTPRIHLRPDSPNPPVIIGAGSLLAFCRVVKDSIQSTLRAALPLPAPKGATLSMSRRNAREGVRAGAGGLQAPTRGSRQSVVPRRVPTSWIARGIHPISLTVGADGGIPPVGSSGPASARKIRDHAAPSRGIHRQLISPATTGGPAPIPIPSGRT
jgi:hypothetical protein